MKELQTPKPPEHIPQPGEFLPAITVHKNGKKKEFIQPEVDEFDWMTAFRRKNI